MRAVRLADLRELLQGPAFAAWWTDWQRACASERDARARRDDLLAQSELMALRSELARRAAADASARAGAAEAARPRRARAASLERALLSAERGLAARRLRREAARSLQEAKERRARATRLAAEAGAAAGEAREAEARQAALLATARETLGCAAGTAFLYWRREDDERAALAVALADDPDADGGAVKALAIYTVRPARGGALLAPARDAAGRLADGGDRCIDATRLDRRRASR
jgi:hypothetical protein